MLSSLGPNTDPAVLTQLVEKCSALCSNADTVIQKLDEEQGVFLAHNLEGALQQLELILRVIGDGQPDEQRDSDRQGFLRRLFARETGPDAKDKPARPAIPPNFDVSKQGLFGNSWTVGLAELLGFLAFGNKTGVLWIDSPKENFIVSLIDGKLVHGTSDHTPEGLRLGEVLVGLGYLTRRQLERFLSRSEGESVSGEELLDSGMISDEELNDALKHQVKQLFMRLVRTQNAVFRFSEGMQIELAHTVDLDINLLLLDSAKENDEEGNAAQRAANALQEWNNWQKSLAKAAGNVAQKQTSTGNTVATEESSTTTPEKTSANTSAKTPVDVGKSNVVMAETKATQKTDSDQIGSAKSAQKSAQKTSDTPNMPSDTTAPEKTVKDKTPEKAKS